jgi:outer membrane protein
MLPRGLLAGIGLLLCSFASLAAEQAPGAAPLPYLVETAVTEARAHSGSLRVKILDATAKGYAVKEAQTRALPQLSLTASATYMTKPPEGITISQGAFGSAPQIGSEFPIFIPDQDYVIIPDTEPTYFTVTGSLDQVIWSWGKIRKAVEISRLDQKAAEVAVTAAGRDLDRDVVKAYFGAIVSRDSARLLGEAETLARGMVEDQQRALDAGTVTRQDVLEAKSRLAQIASQRVRAEEGLETALAGLEYLSGSRPDALSLVSPFRESLPDIAEDALVSSSLGSSTDLQSLRIKGEQARLAEEIRRASLIGLPDFSLNLKLSVEGQEIPFVGGNWTDTWDTNLLLTVAGRVTLFDSLASVYRLKQAQLQREQAATGAAELARSIPAQTRRLVEAARIAAAAVQEKRADLDFARERARNATVSWENEMITRTEERGASLAAISAELQLLLAQLEAETAIGELEYASGTSFPRG